MQPVDDGSAPDRCPFSKLQHGKRLSRSQGAEAEALSAGNGLGGFLPIGELTGPRNYRASSAFHSTTAVRPGLHVHTCRQAGIAAKRPGQVTARCLRSSLRSGGPVSLHKQLRARRSMSLSTETPGPSELHGFLTSNLCIAALSSIHSLSIPQRKTFWSVFIFRRVWPKSSSLRGH